MTTHNWIRCHWRNGRHVLHDVPEAWHAQIESHISANRCRAEALGRVHTATLESVEIAWVECEVPLGSPERDLTYRRARAVHALVRPRSEAGRWTPLEAETLFAQRYAEPADRGLVHQHRVLSALEYPRDASCADGLFVGREAPLPSMSEPSRTVLDFETAGYTRRHLIDAWEDWVAEGAQAKCAPSRRGIRPLQTPDALLAPVLAARAHADAASAATVGVEMQAPPATVGGEETQAPTATVGRESHVQAATWAAIAEPARPARPVECASAEPKDLDAGFSLFDLTRVRTALPDAPASSLSGLLGPSRTTPVI